MTIYFICVCQIVFAGYCDENAIHDSVFINGEFENFENKSIKVA